MQIYIYSGAQLPCPCRKAIDHKLSCDCDDASAAPGRQFTILECFREAAVNDSKARAETTLGYFDSVYPANSSATGLEVRDHARNLLTVFIGIPKEKFVLKENIRLTDRPGWKCAAH